MSDIKEPAVTEGTTQGENETGHSPVDASAAQQNGNGDAEPQQSTEGGPANVFPGEEFKEVTGDDAETMRILLHEKEEEVKEKHDRWLRAQAELENFKKRTAREKADLLKFSNEQLMKELLPVLDNLDRSLNHARTAKSVEILIEGVDLVRKSLFATMERFGLKEVAAAREEKFDPSRHEATVRLETVEHPEGTVVEEFQKGYFIHDRLLRPALVAVAALPPATPTSTDT